MNKLKKNKLPLVHIIIGNKNNYQLTIDCLKSIKKITYPRYKVVVYDNTSTDNSVKEISKNVPNIQLIRNKKDLGFAGGNNVAIKYCLKNKADYIMLLNNDTLVEKKLLEDMIKECQNNNNIGIIGPKIMYYPQKELIYSAGGNINLWIGGSKMYGKKQFDQKNVFDKKKEVDYVTGCCILIKKEVFDEIGLLDEDYYAYFEETDFCLRAKRIGYKIVYLPKKLIYHRVASTFKYLSNFYIYQMIRNVLIFMKKNASWYHWVSFSLVFLFYMVPGYIFLGLIKYKNTQTIQMMLLGTYDFLTHRWGRTRIIN